MGRVRGLLCRPITTTGTTGSKLTTFPPERTLLFKARRISRPDAIGNPGKGQGSVPSGSPLRIPRLCRHLQLMRLQQPPEPLCHYVHRILNFRQLVPMEQFAP